MITVSIPIQYRYNLVVYPEKALDFIAQLPVEKFWGVGSRTAEIMHNMGVFTGSQLRACSLKHLNEVFGKAGTVFYHFARGNESVKVF